MKIAVNNDRGDAFYNLRMPLLFSKVPILKSLMNEELLLHRRVASCCPDVVWLYPFRPFLFDIIDLLANINIP